MSKESIDVDLTLKVNGLNKYTSRGEIIDGSFLMINLPSEQTIKEFVDAEFGRDVEPVLQNERALSKEPQ